MPEPEPISFPIRPANRGLDVSLPPHAIDYRSSPDLINVRFRHANIQVRDGFTKKYGDLPEPAMLVDAVYAGGSGGTLVAFTELDMYYESSDLFTPVDLYDGTGAGVAASALTVSPETDWFALDVARGKVTVTNDLMGGGGLWPASGYGDIMIWCNGLSDGVFIVIDNSGIKGEKLVGANDPTQARAIVFFARRCVLGGPDNNYAEIWWSDVDDFNTFDTAANPGAGSVLVGEGADWIQALKRMGEFLIIYKERSIYIGRQSGLTDPAIYVDPAPGEGIGLAAPQSIGDLGEEHIFMGWDDVYVFSLKGGPIPIGTRIKEQLFYGENGVLPEYINRCYGAIAEEYNEYWLFVPTGRIPEATNVLTNPRLDDDDANNVPDNWTIAADGDGAATTQTGGYFGDDYPRLTFSAGTYVSMTSALYDYNTDISGRLFGALVWLKADGDCDVTITIRSSDAAGAVHTTTVNETFSISTGTAWEAVIFSGAIATALHEQVSLIIQLDTADVNLDVDCAQLVDMHSIDDVYRYTSDDGYVAPAFLGPTDEAVLIPFIVKAIGPWTTDTVWVYNYEEDCWSAWRLMITGFGYDTLTSTLRIADLVGKVSEQTWRFDQRLLTALAPTNLLAQACGNVYESSAVSTYDWQGLLNSSVTCYWESKDFDLDLPEQAQTLSRVVIIHAVSHPAITVTMGMSINSGEDWVEKDVTIRNGYTTTFCDFLNEIGATGNQHRFRIKTDGPGLAIRGFSVKVIPRGEEFNVSAT